MFYKRATLTVVEIEPLNVPVVYEQASAMGGHVRKSVEGIQVRPNILAETLGQIKTASNKEADIIRDGNNTDFDLEADIRDHPDSLFVKCFAIKADEMNDNGDYFPREELKRAVPTFVGVPAYTNHQNTDINQARGKVIHSWWDDERDGISIIARIDAAAYPQLARGITQEYISKTSMGASRGHDLVLMGDGTKKRVDEMQVGDEVVTHTGKTESVTAIVQTQEHSKLYHIRWSGSLSGLALSYEHPVLTLKKDDVYYKSSGGKTYRKTAALLSEILPEFVPSSELKLGNYVLELVDREVVEDYEINNEIAFILGLYAAEGYTRHDLVEFCMGSGDQNINKLLKYLKNNYNNYIREYDYTEDRNGYYIRVRDKNLINLCNAYVGSGAKTKFLSGKIKHWNTEYQKIFLGAYLDGDGCVVKERIGADGHSSGKGAMQASSASIQLLRDIRQLCLRVGCSATLSSHNRIAKSSTVVDNDFEYIEHMLYISNNISTVLHEYSYKAHGAEKCVQTKADSFFYQDKYIAHRVKDVTIIDNNEPTYYLQVGNLEDENSDHSYILNDIATHNCQVQFSICSICHNLASTPDQFCSHIKERKTRLIEAKNQKCEYHKNGTEDECPICGCKKGETKKYAVNQKAFEYNYGIKFIENSFVSAPACLSCGVTEIIDPKEFLSKISDIQDRLPHLLKAASSTKIMCSDKGCVNLLSEQQVNDVNKALSFFSDFKGTIEKVAGQKELGDLNQSLTLVTGVLQSMLKQRQQLDMEFVSQGAEVLKDLQELTDELTQQGYGRIPSPEEGAEATTPTPPTPEGTPPPAAGTPAPTMQPVNPTPGGGSNVMTGTAGPGTVTAPTAKAKLDLLKSGKIIDRDNSFRPKMNIHKGKRLTPKFKVK